MYHEKFIKFLHTLDMDNNLLEAILGGYKAVFNESMNAWAYNTPPTPVGINEPMGSYQKIMKQLPSSIGAVGAAGDTTGTGNSSYKYGEALPGSTRDIGEETREDWKSPPKFEKHNINTLPLAKKLMKQAQSHIPVTGDNMHTPMAYRTNFPNGTQLGNFDVDSSLPRF